MASLTPKNLYIGNTSGSSVYTSGANVGDYTIIKNINFCNSNTTIAKSVSLNIFANGGSASESNILISNLLIPPNDVVQIDAAIVLNANSNVYITHTGNITTTISGAEFK